LVGKVNTGCAVFLLQHLCNIRGPEHGAVTVLTEISDLHGCEQGHLHIPAVLLKKKALVDGCFGFRKRFHTGVFPIHWTGAV